MENIFYNRQFLDNSDLKEVQKSLKEKLITTGPYVKKLELSLQKYLGVKNAISCSVTHMYTSTGLFPLNKSFRTYYCKKNNKHQAHENEKKNA